MVFRLRGVRGRVLSVAGSVSDQQGKEASQSILGVGSGLGDDPDSADLTGIATGLCPPVPVLLILHISLFIGPVAGRTRSLRRLPVTNGPNKRETLSLLL